MSSVAISYTLYRKDGNNNMQPVSLQADLDLQGKIRTEDSNPSVDQESDPEQQGMIIDDHVTGVLYDVDLDGFKLAFPHSQDSRWDSTTANWVSPQTGGSVVFPVCDATHNPSNTPLFVMVATPGT